MSFDRLIQGQVPTTDRVITTSPMDRLVAPQKLGWCGTCPKLGDVTPLGIPPTMIAVGLIGAFFLFGGMKLLKK